MISFSSSSTYISSTLLLFGEDLDPENINTILGVPATKSFKKGDTFSQGRNARKSGMWSLEMKGDSGIPSQHIKRFVEIVPKNLLPVSKICGVESGRLSLWIDSDDESSTFEIQIDQDDIELIKNLGVQLSITYFEKIDDE